MLRWRLRGRPIRLLSAVLFTALMTGGVAAGPGPPSPPPAGSGGMAGEGEWANQAAERAVDQHLVAADRDVGADLEMAQPSSSLTCLYPCSIQFRML